MIKMALPRRIPGNPSLETPWAGSKDFTCAPARSLARIYHGWYRSLLVFTHITSNAGQMQNARSGT
jgi:hypothetical protein